MRSQCLERHGYRCGILVLLSLALRCAGAQVPQDYLSRLPQPAPRIVNEVDDSRFTTLHGNTHPLAIAANDRGSVLPSQPMRRMLMLLRRSPEQDSALTSLLEAQQQPGSPLFHQWLSPQQFGAAFGPADQDVATITNWLAAHGFTNLNVSYGRTVIEFSGTADQVQSAFHTAVHSYQVFGSTHFANQSDPGIPTALAPVVAGVVSLNGFGHTANAIRGPALQYANGESHPRIVSPANPDFTVPQPAGNPTFYGVAPYDFATIYDLLPLWTNGLDGTGQTIAIVGQTDINVNDPEQFRAFFGLPVNNPLITVVGIDPGVQSDETEADLDVEWSGAIAKGAQVQFVTSATTETTAGVDLSAIYIVDNNLAPVMSESYGGCELFVGTTGNAFESAMWQQASAEGITVLVSSGDQGSAGCDTSGLAVHPMAVNALASSPYDTAVGGTDFNQYNSWSTYWSASSDPTTKKSVLGYIPEIPWNASCGSTILDSTEGVDPSNACTGGGPLNTVATSGGPSSCISSNGSDPTTCTGGWPKPIWQSGVGVPSDGVRDVPDVSLFASNNVYGSAYVVCQVDATGGSGCNPTASTQSFLAVGGTSGSTPAMAGVMAIVNQKYGRQGNANPTLYRLAASSSGASIFHDITADGNRVACTSMSSDCVIPAGASEPIGKMKGHDSTVGYDMVTGLGSIDIANLVNNWASVSFASTHTTLALNGGTGLVTAVHGTSISASANVSATSGTPTGDVSLLGTGSSAAVLLGTLVGGAVNKNVSSLPGGSYTVAARYGGDTQFAPSESSPISVKISPESSTTKLSILNYNPASKSFASASSVPYGSLLLVRTDVSGQSGQGTATGSIALTDAGNTIGQFPLNSQASTEYLPNNLILGGSHPLQASYPGDSSFNSSASTNNITVTPAQTSCGVGSNTTYLRPGWTIRLYPAMSLYQQTVTAPLGNMVAPTGTLTVYSGSTIVDGPATGTSQGGGIVSQSGGITTFTTPAMDLPPATLQISQLESVTAPITVTYSGDSNYAPCTSPPLQLTYQTGPIASAVYNTYSPQGNIQVGTPVVVTTQVGPSTGPPAYEPSYVAPSGTVQLAVDGTNLGPPMSLTSASGVFPTVGYANYGAASFTIPTNGMSVGTHTFSVIYGGDANYLSSASYTTNFFLVVPDFSMSIVPGGLTVTNGQTSGPTTVSISPLNSFAGVVTFACSGLPTGASCVFSPTSVTTSGSTSLSITTTKAQDVIVPVLVQNSPHKFGWLFGAEGISSAFILVFFVRRRWRKAVVICLALAAGLTFGITSCGGGSGGGSTSSPPSSTQTGLSATTSSPAKGVNDTFTATVSSASGTQPTGTVQFNVDGFASGSPVELTNASAQLVTSFATAGVHTVVAAYSGDSTHLSSTSSPDNVTVPYSSGSIPGTYFVTVTATSGTLTHTQTLTLTVQ